VGPTLEWIRQFGTPVINAVDIDGDSIEGISLDGLGSLYISGKTWGSLAGPNAGGEDSFLGKFDVAGNQQWMRQFGTATTGFISDVSADGLGNVFHTDFYSGVGGVLNNYDADGNELWSRQGAGGGGLSADGIGNVYTTGVTTVSATDEDGLVKKYDAAGNQLWSRQFGSSDYDQRFSVSADPIGNVFVIGVIVGPSINQRVFLTKFDSAGTEHWTRELESARYVYKGGVSADGLGNVYISGSSNAPLAEPRLHLGQDAFLAKYDGDGNRLWIDEFGTADGRDHASGVSVDGLGNVYVSGSTSGSLGGPNAGEDDAFLAKYAVNGNQLWIHQFGTTANENAHYISADGSRNVFIAGSTRGDLGGLISDGGGSDVFIAKFNDSVPEPSTALLMFVAAVIICARRQRSLTGPRNAVMLCS